MIFNILQATATQGLLLTTPTPNTLIEPAEPSARIVLNNLVFNGFYYSFGISGHFLASQNPVIFLQYPPFSNLHRCLSLLKRGDTNSMYGSDSIWIIWHFKDGDKAYVNMGLPWPLLGIFSFKTRLSRCSLKVL
jgi:hypothetical protein